ncbi:hypothetical protein, partial [Escherichia coli]|uniref:hypothetical protein n=1 Tax=Escherichia coli TaxID=562 RepID=UPI001BB47EFE
MSTLLSLIGVFRHTNNKFIRIAKQTGASLLPIFHPMMLSPGGANPDVDCMTKAAKSRDKNPPLCSEGWKFGGAKRDRTADLLHAMQALS